MGAGSKQLSMARALRRVWSRAKQPAVFVQRQLKRTLLGTIVAVDTEQQVAALTFDDGPDPRFTPRLLKILERYQAQATFFMVGESAEKYPALVERVARSGHAIGNHTWDHCSLPGLSRAARRKQIQACRSATGSHGQRLLRPPFGHLNAAARFDAALLGYKVVTWSLAVHDWMDHEAEWMTERVVRDIKPGSIILFHDSIYCDWPEDGAPHYDRSQMLAAVEMILSSLQGQYRFLTVPALLKTGRPIKRFWDIQKSEDWKSLSYRW